MAEPVFGGAALTQNFYTDFYFGSMDLFANPVGCRPSLAKCCAFCVFKRKLFGNFKFPNNSNNKNENWTLI
jgi:hypothetical protein